MRWGVSQDKAGVGIGLAGGGLLLTLLRILASFLLQWGSPYLSQHPNSGHCGPLEARPARTTPGALSVHLHQRQNQHPITLSHSWSPAPRCLGAGLQWGRGGWQLMPVKRQLGVVGNRLLEIPFGASLKTPACHLLACVYTGIGWVLGEGAGWGCWLAWPKILLPGPQSQCGDRTLVCVSPFVGKVMPMWVPGDVCLFTYS